ncbi:MAG TPA: hypothetical protein VHE61_05255 [Opitutaceae bacterium]|nr:hypothetical protein [Opitutaceae bacterium]
MAFDPRILELNGKPVVVLTATGTPVSIGRLRVESDDGDTSEPRVVLEFETETMRCQLRIGNAPRQALLETWDGATYRYRLQTEDRVWVPLREEPAPPASPIIETFPIPPSIPSKKLPPPGGAG